jgi:putative transcriptional regulator
VDAELSEKIAGEVVLSAHPGRTLRKWREDFGISQRDLAKSLATVPSVVSDYESERRASPGAAFIRRYVEALLDVDRHTGGRVGQRLGLKPHSDGIVGLREFAVAVPLKALAERLDAEPVSRVVEVYGWTTQRALIFSNVRYGRSPMVAIRAHPLKPAAVVFSHPGRIDPLAVRLSEIENIPLLTTVLEATDVLERLEEL